MPMAAIPHDKAKPRPGRHYGISGQSLKKKTVYWVAAEQVHCLLKPTATSRGYCR